MFRHMLAGAALLVLVGRPAAATTASPLSLERLVHGSDATLAGTVLDAASFWQGSRIYTLARVQVDEVWVGALPADAGREVGVLTLGGRVGDIGQRVDGAAVLRPRRQVVLHLRRQRGGEYVTYGMAQGLWEVDAPPRQPARVGRPHVDALVGAAATGAAAAAGARAWPQTLAQLKQAVLAAAATPPDASR